MAYLILENGKVFEGELFGDKKNISGKIVFHTGVVGYTELLTDPSSAGDIIVFTMPVIGNYGVNEEDCESLFSARGAVVREFCTSPSNFRMKTDIDAFMKKRGICGICGIDTRAIAEIIREEGEMSAKICESSDVTESSPVGFEYRNECECIEGNGHTVVCPDFGIRNSEINSLKDRGCRVVILPPGSDAEKIMSYSPDGIFLSGAPEKADNYNLGAIKELFGKIPMFAVGDGHLLLASAAGGSIEKMKCGHRGANQPVKKPGSDRVYITPQNHGCEVSSHQGKVIFENANDKTPEGIEYPGKKAFSVHFYPQTRDTLFLWDEFIKMMGDKK